MPVTEQDRLEETERQAGAAADELAERNERLGEHIEQIREDWDKAKADTGTPTASSDWEDSEPDDTDDEDPAGFDDPENVDLDDDEDDYTDDEDE